MKIDPLSNDQDKDINDSTVKLQTQRSISKYSYSEADIIAFDIAILLDHDSKGFIEINEFHTILKKIIDQINHDNKPIKANQVNVDTQTTILLDIPKLEDMETVAIYRNQTYILTLESFATYMKEIYKSEDLTKIHYSIYQNKFRFLPGFMAKAFLWIRKANAESSLVKHNTAEEITEKDYVGAFITLFNSVLEGIDYATDIILLVKIYEYGTRPDQLSNKSYTTLLVVRIIAVISHYLIAYSSAIQLILHKGMLDSTHWSNHNCLVKMFLLLFFTFISPIYFVFLLIFDISFKFIQALLVIFLPTKCGYFKVVSALNRVIYAMGLEINEYNDFMEQRSIAQLMFQDLIVLVMDTLLISGAIYAPGIVEESWTTLLTSYITTTVNIIIKFFIFKIRADYLREDFLNYCLLSMKAKFGWIPFLRKIKNEEFTDRIIDFHFIRCPIPLVTSLIGIYQDMKYVFSELTIRRLFDAVSNIKLTGTKNDLIQEIAIGRCLTRVSIQSIVQLISISSAEVIILDFGGINWKDCINFSKRYKKLEFCKEKQTKWESLTFLGESLFITIIKNEGLSTDFKFKDLMIILLEEGADPDTRDLYGRTPLLYAIKHDKKTSVEILLDYDANPNLPNYRGDEVPLYAASITKRNTDIVKLLFSKGSDPHYIININNEKKTIFTCIIEWIMTADEYDKRKPILLEFIHQGVKVINEQEKHALLLAMSYLSARDRSIDDLLKAVPENEDPRRWVDMNGNTFLHLYLHHVDNDKRLEPYYNFIREKIDPSYYPEKHNNLKENPLCSVLRVGNSHGVRLAINELNLKLDLKDPKMKENAIDFCRFKILAHDLNGLNFDLQKVPEKDELINLAQELLKKRVKPNENKNPNNDIPNIQTPDIVSAINVNVNTNPNSNNTPQNKPHTNNALAIPDNAIDLEKQPDKKKKGLGKVCNEPKYRTINLFEIILILVLEVTSLFDLITDILVLQGLVVAGHRAWTALSILTMITPYFISYAPVITFFIERGVFEKSDQQEDSSKTKALLRRLFGVFFLTPCCMIYFIILDLIYVKTQILINLYYLVLYTVTLGKAKQGTADECLDRIFQKAFNLNNMDVRGLRRLRTISQLIFESIPQMILQARMLAYGAEDLGATPSALLISLSLAILHFFLETWFLYLESISCKSNFLYYAMVCLNGRLNWVPFVDKMTRIRDPKDDGKYNYGKLNYSLCGHEFNMYYEFYDTTIDILSESLSHLPSSLKSQNMIEIDLGHTCDFVSFSKFLVLLQLGKPKAKLIIDNIDWNKMFPPSFDITKPENLIGPDGENILYTFTKLGYYQPLEKVLEKGCNPNGILSSDNTEISLAQIASENGDFKTLQVLVNYGADISKVTNYHNIISRAIDTKNYGAVVIIFSLPTFYANRYIRLNAMHMAIDLIENGYYQQTYQITDELDRDNPNGLRIIDIIGGVEHEIYGEVPQVIAKKNQKLKAAELIFALRNFPIDTIWFRFIKGDQLREYKRSIIEKFKLFRTYLPGSRPIGHDSLANGLGSKKKPYTIDLDIDLGLFDILYHIISNNSVLSTFTKDKLGELDDLMMQIGIDENVFHDYFIATDSFREQVKLVVEVFDTFDVSASSGIDMDPSLVFAENSAQYIKVKTLKIPKNILAIKSLSFKGIVYDQGWGGTGLSDLVTFLRTKTDSFFESIVNVNREKNPDNQYNLVYNKDNMLSMLQIPISDAEIEFYIKSPPYPGWSAGTEGFTAVFTCYTKSI